MITPLRYLLCHSQALELKLQSPRTVSSARLASAWCDLLGMAFYASKTKTMIVLRSRNASPVTSFNYWSNCAEWVWWPRYVKSDIWIHNDFWDASLLGVRVARKWWWFICQDSYARRIFGRSNVTMYSGASSGCRVGALVWRHRGFGKLRRRTCSCLCLRNDSVPNSTTISPSIIMFEQYKIKNCRLLSILTFRNLMFIQKLEK